MWGVKTKTKKQNETLYRRIYHDFFHLSIEKDCIM